MGKHGLDAVTRHLMAELDVEILSINGEDDGLKREGVESEFTRRMRTLTGRLGFGGVQDDNFARKLKQKIEARQALKDEPESDRLGVGARKLEREVTTRMVQRQSSVRSPRRASISPRPSQEARASHEAALLAELDAKPFWLDQS